MDLPWMKKMEEPMQRPLRFSLLWSSIRPKASDAPDWFLFHDFPSATSKASDQDQEDF